MRSDLIPGKSNLRANRRSAANATRGDLSGFFWEVLLRSEPASPIPRLQAKRSSSSLLAKVSGCERLSLRPRQRLDERRRPTTRRQRPRRLRLGPRDDGLGRFRRPDGICRRARIPIRSGDVGFRTVVILLAGPFAVHGKTPRLRRLGERLGTGTLVPRLRRHGWVTVCALAALTTTRSFPGETDKTARASGLRTSSSEIAKVRRPSRAR